MGIYSEQKSGLYGSSIYAYADRVGKDVCCVPYAGGNENLLPVGVGGTVEVLNYLLKTTN